LVGCGEASFHWRSLATATSDPKIWISRIAPRSPPATAYSPLLYGGNLLDLPYIRRHRPAAAPDRHRRRERQRFGPAHSKALLDTVAMRENEEERMPSLHRIPGSGAAQPPAGREAFIRSPRSPFIVAPEPRSATVSREPRMLWNFEFGLLVLHPTMA
jgi:hypothetical protein